MYFQNSFDLGQLYSININIYIYHKKTILTKNSVILLDSLGRLEKILVSLLRKMSYSSPRLSFNK